MSGLGDRRAFGSMVRQVAPLCLGGNVFGWTADQETSFAVLDAYVAAGGNFIDSANIYSAWVPGNQGGESERILGDWLKARGDASDVIIATKLGMEGGAFRKGLTRDLIRRGVEGSLERLGVDRIDLLYAHEDDAATPLSETMEAFDEVVREGLVEAVAALPLETRVELAAEGAPIPVTAPRALAEIEIGELEAGLRRALGRAVRVQGRIDAGLIAGLEIETAHARVRNSLRADLEAIQNKLLTRDG